MFIDDIKYRFFLGDTNFKVMRSRDNFMDYY